MAYELLQEALQRVPLFAQLDEPELEAICGVVRQRTYPKGSVIVFEGDPGDAFYLLLSGEVKVLIQGAEGREFILAFLRAGDFFGELSLLDDQPRSATVMTTEACTVLVLDKAAFLAQVQHASGILFKLLTALCQRLRALSERSGDLVLLEVYQRIAKTLLALGKTMGAPRGGAELVITKRPTHQDIANMVGTSRETVTRVLNDLEKHGCIALSQRAMVIRKGELEDVLRQLRVSA